MCKRYAHDEEAADDQEETGWKYIHSDVFKYPKHKSLFTDSLGFGTQLFRLAAHLEQLLEENKNITAKDLIDSGVRTMCISDSHQVDLRKLFLIHLQGVIKLGEWIPNKPDGLCVDQNGMLYSATRYGWVKISDTNGTWENWKMIHNKHTLLGLTVTRAGDLIVCDTEEGLIKVSKDGAVTDLATHMNGENIKFAHNVVEASDGSLYFSVASTKFGLDDAHLDKLHAKPHGQLSKYNPFTMETSVVLDGLGFANGLAISSDPKVPKKYSLKEEIRVKVEIFINNLPGSPNNINLAPDGSFWIAILQVRLWLQEILWDKKHDMDVYRCKGVLRVVNSNELHTVQVLIEPSPHHQHRRWFKEESHAFLFVSLHECQDRNILQSCDRAGFLSGIASSGIVFSKETRTYVAGTRYSLQDFPTNRHVFKIFSGSVGGRCVVSI